MKKVNFSKQSQKLETVEGLMSFGVMEGGRRTADFACCEDVELEPFSGQCKVQIMRDGNVYVTEMPRRVRNRALFREDNCSFSYGRDGRFYFVFSMDGRDVGRLPTELIRQAGSIARKVLKQVVFNHPVC